MLSHEWRELEALCSRISDMRERYAHARRGKTNFGLIESLKDDIEKAVRQRELLVRHISARLGSAAAEPERPPTLPPPPPSLRRRRSPVEPHQAIVGFEDG